jgi:6-phosphogluconate dehydrogenase
LEQTEMQIGVVGLGRMGANIVRRRERGKHECVAYDADASLVARPAAEGLPVLPSLEALVQRLAPPRVVWVMVPAGAPTEATVSANCCSALPRMPQGTSPYALFHGRQGMQQ